MTGIAPEISSEKSFSDLWERSLALRPDVVDRDGNSYEIVFPGIRNTGPGPDFRGAVLKHRGRTMGGDVELHMVPSGWRGHGHHVDPNYNGVVLQVVLRTGRGLPRAHSPPTAVVTFPDRAADDRTKQATVEEAELERLGVERFIAKSAAYRLHMESGADADQAIYRGVMEAMGYARNRRPFLTLAGALPISRFAGLRDEPESAARFAVFAALVVGGGLIERTDSAERAQVKRVTRRLGVRRRLRPEDWSMFRVRPVNSPAAEDARHGAHRGQVPPRRAALGYALCVRPVGRTRSRRRGQRASVHRRGAVQDSRGERSAARAPRLVVAEPVGRLAAGGRRLQEDARASARRRYQRRPARSLRPVVGLRAEERGAALRPPRARPLGVLAWGSLSSLAAA